MPGGGTGRRADASRLGRCAAGLVGAPPVQVVVGDEVHAAVLKALGLIGLGRGRAVRLRTDDQERIVPGGLPELDAPAIVCLQAGNVNSGASDPFAPLNDWAHAFDTLRAARRSSYRRGSQAAQARRGQRVPNKN